MRIFTNYIIETIDDEFNELAKQVKDILGKLDETDSLYDRISKLLDNYTYYTENGLFNDNSKEQFIGKFKKIIAEYNDKTNPPTMETPVKVEPTQEPTKETKQKSTKPKNDKLNTNNPTSEPSEETPVEPTPTPSTTTSSDTPEHYENITIKKLISDIEEINYTEISEMFKNTMPDGLTNIQKLGIEFIAAGMGLADMNNYTEIKKLIK